jgi:type I restriction enzyme, S subunit
VNETNPIESLTSLRKFKPYPTYKESVVEWLGKLPAQWGLKRLKRIVQFRGGGTPTKDNVEYWRGDIPWVSPKDMKVAIVVDTEDKITSEAVRESATNFVPAGSVLIVVRSGILIHSIPVALAGRDLTLNQDLKALIPRQNLLPEYLVYLISGMQRQLLVEWKTEGATVESLELDLVANTPTPLPSIPEQHAISAFLARETAKIDALVAKKERLIELLQEKRAALITRSVTKGLDPNVPMKDSGIEWLGEIPAHWKVKRIKWVARMESGHTPDKKIESYWQGGDIPWVSLADTGQLREVDRIVNTAVMTTADGIVACRRHRSITLPAAGDLILAAGPALTDSRPDSTSWII